MSFLHRHFLKFISLILLISFCLVVQANTKNTTIKIALIEGLSGPFGNTGEAVFRNLIWAVERVNKRGGIKVDGQTRMLELKRFDSQGKSANALSSLRAVIDDGMTFVMQGNSSGVATGLIDAINKHNVREPNKRILFLNYSAVDPALTDEGCSFWHFRFDAHANMRMSALMSVLQEDKDLKKVYIIGQDYSFGHAVAKEAKRQLASLRTDVKVVGEELHPLGRVKDFVPYAVKIKASGAQAVITGNFGNDLTLLIKAAKDIGFKGKFYTFYGNALGAPAAIGQAGVGKVVAVADWFPNVLGQPNQDFYASFRQRFPNPKDDYVHMRMHLMILALAEAIEQANSTDALPVALALEKAQVKLAGQSGHMRSQDHQFQQPLVVAVMDKQGQPGVRFDVEGSGFGFRVIKTLSAQQAIQPTTCQMKRP